MCTSFAGGFDPFGRGLSPLVDSSLHELPADRRSGFGQFSAIQLAILICVDTLEMLLQHFRGFRLADLAVFILVGSLQASTDHSSVWRAVWPTRSTLHAVSPSLPRGGRATHAA